MVGSSSPPVTLAGLAEQTGGRRAGDTDPEIRGITHDSRRVAPGDLFVALRGAEVDGHSFVAAAVEAGAVAVLVEEAGPWPVPALIVDDVRGVLGPVAHTVFGEPTQRLEVVGVTGTNGKTTTVFMIAEVLDAGSGPAASVGTLGARLRGEVRATGLTTPEATDLARLLADLEQAGARSVAMEVSSHAVVMKRIDGIRFAAGVFTNLSPDHLDFHESMEDYGEAKLRFFRRLAEQGAFAVTNLDDPWGSRFRTAGPDDTWAYSTSDPTAEVFAERLEVSRDRTEMTVRTPEGSFSTTLAMAGHFNAMNALAAASVGIGLGVEPEVVGDALSRVRHVPGRYEVHRGADVTVIVDYAHTPQAIERILEAVRDSGAPRIVCVFGCGGERDRTKRPEMARVAGSLAERVFLTTDNPRREPIDQIAADTIIGFEGTTAEWERVDDRAEAIERAIGEAQPGDVVCVLGKGDEAYIAIGDQKIPFRDREVVARALAARAAT